MVRRSLSSDLVRARVAKNDEFYTQLEDIAEELYHYENHFKNKVVYCNCDDPRESNFFYHFAHNFHYLGLKKLITTCYKNQNPDIFSEHDSEKAVCLEYTGGSKIQGEFPVDIKNLKGDGDFRSAETIEFLKEADIVVTNPPFSLFREYVAQLIEYDKKFIILGHQNATSYKEIFKLIKDNKVWLGFENGGTKWFGVQNHYDIKTESRKKIENGKKFFSMGSVNWFTNLDISKRNEELRLYKSYYGDESDYPKYDNYDAINVDRIKDIPKDYKGNMGVPITFLDKYNPAQFEILDSNEIRINKNVTPYKDHGLIKDKDGSIDGKPKYVRIVIRNKKL